MSPTVPALVAVLSTPPPLRSAGAGLKRVVRHRVQFLLVMFLLLWDVTSYAMKQLPCIMVSDAASHVEHMCIGTVCSNKCPPTTFPHVVMTASKQHAPTCA